MSDDETLKTGVAHGRKWRVAHIRGKHLAGYVQTNLSDPWHHDDLQGFEGGPLEGHGSITYGPDEDGWIGFDCAHSGDVSIVDGEVTTDYGGGSREREWTVDDVAAECRSLARQVKGLEELLERFAEIQWGGEDGA